MRHKLFIAPLKTDQGGLITCFVKIVTIMEWTIAEIHTAKSRSLDLQQLIYLKDFGFGLIGKMIR